MSRERYQSPIELMAYDDGYQQGKADRIEMAMINDGVYCWHICSEFENCERCRRIGNGDIDFYDDTFKERSRQMTIQDRFGAYCEDRGTCAGCPYSKHNEGYIDCALNFAYQQGKADVIEPIKQIIYEYKNGIDEWAGQDESYVLGRIMEQIGAGE